MINRERGGQELGRSFLFANALQRKPLPFHHMVARFLPPIPWSQWLGWSCGSEILAWMDGCPVPRLPGPVVTHHGW